MRKPEEMQERFDFFPHVFIFYTLNIVSKIEKVFMQELSWASHLSLPAVVIPAPSFK